MLPCGYPPRPAYIRRIHDITAALPVHEHFYQIPAKMRHAYFKFAFFVYGYCTLIKHISAIKRKALPVQTIPSQFIGECCQYRRVPRFTDAELPQQVHGFQPALCVVRILDAQGISPFLQWRKG